MKIQTRYGLVAGLAFSLTALAGDAGGRRQDFLEQRKSAVEASLGLVEIQQERTGADLELNAKRVKACQTLGEVRSKAAVPSLIKHLVELSDRSTPREELPPLEELFPAVYALVRIGKPASLACLDEIAKSAIPTTLPKNSVQDPRFRIELLTLVISGVETSKVAELMLTKRIEKATEAENKSLAHALALVQQQLKTNR